MKRLSPHRMATAAALTVALFTPLVASAQNYYPHHDRTHTVCRDVRVQDSGSRDNNRVAGTAIGAIAGGLLGHTIGGGNGKTLTTVGGAVAGGYIGNRVEANHQRRRSHIERRCWQERN